MAKYTTEVRTICEAYAGEQCQVGYSRIDEVIQKSLPKIFDFNFPIFDEAYRNVLETKIIKHYFTREIGEETVSLWKYRLNVKLNEIMPKYNKMYIWINENSNVLFENYRMNTDGDRSAEGQTSGTTKGTDKTTATDKSTDYSLFSDTPQGSLNGVNSENYLTNATKNTSDSSTVSNGESSVNSTNNATSAEEYAELKHGYISSKPMFELVQSYFQKMDDIDMLIINDLNTLFFGLW